MNTKDRTEFEQMPLFVHEFLAGVPLRTLDRIDLPGGKSYMTVLDIKETVGFNTEKLEPGGITKALFWLRGLIGRLFGWDDADKLVESVSWLPRLTRKERARSLITPGKKEGISRLLYCFENEFLAEIVNKTVHCFWVMATKQTADGYVLYMAVYVRKLNWFTPIYMALVTPMLKWVIYPALNKSIKKRWMEFTKSNLSLSR